MAVTTLFNPQVVQAELITEPFCPEQIGATLIHRNDVIIINVRTDEFLFAPDPAAVGILRAHVAVFKEGFPVSRRALFQCVYIVPDL